MSGQIKPQEDTRNTHRTRDARSGGREMGERFLVMSGELMEVVVLFGMLVTMYTGALGRKRDLVICNVIMLACTIASVVGYIEWGQKCSVENMRY